MQKIRLRKRILIPLGILVLLIGASILFISPITKYVIEKYDVSYSGREVKMDWVYVNPFTGYVHFSGLKIYEPQSDSILLSANGLSANFAMHKLFSKTYEISQITLDEPKGRIIQHKKELNFDDLIKLFTPKKTDAPPGPPVHFSILSIKIRNGEFRYNVNEIPINYFIRKVNCECSGFRWNTDTVAAELTFFAGKANAAVKGDFMINYKTLDYRFAVLAQKFDLEIIDQYLKALVNYGTFRANIDANIRAKGNFKDQEDITASGLLTINDLHFGKNLKEDYASFEKLVIDIDELSPKYHKYLFDSLWLSHPYFKYERYDHMDNLETMFGKNGAKINAVAANPQKFNLVIEIARYVKVLARNFFRSTYKINKLSIIRGDFQFNDYSLNEKFSIIASPLSLHADSISKSKDRVKVYLNSHIKPYGEANVFLSINPKDSSDFDIRYHLSKIPVSLFNSYLTTYTSFSLNRGTLDLRGNWTVRNGNIKSDNHLLVINPRVSERVKTKKRNWVPVPLLMTFVRERGNVIDYEIPITGNLKNPKFHFRDVLTDIVKNLFIKPSTIPYGMHVKNMENEIEQSLIVRWELKSYELENNQEKFIEKIAKFLKSNPEAVLSIKPNTYLEKEKEQLLFFEAKKKYYLASRKLSYLTEKDSILVVKLSVKDAAFVKYVDGHINHTLLFTMQEKCMALISAGNIDNKYIRLLKNRENTFISFFTENDTRKQIQIHTNVNTIPYNGFSFFRIDYKGEVPLELTQAFESLLKMNGEAPRKKYFAKRKQYLQLSGNK